MNKNLMIAGVVGLVILLAGGYFFMQSQGENPATIENDLLMEEVSEPTDETLIDDQTGTAEGALTSQNVVEFEVSGEPFAFDVTEMKVKKGDTVKVTFTNTEGMHDWVIDEFDVKTNVLQVGESETIEFVADQTGEFEYYCSVGNHRAQGMVGTLIVE